MTEIISVRFKSGGKQYYFDPQGVQVVSGQGVIIETARGVEYGECVQGNTMVPDESVVPPLRPMLRVATPEDEKIVERNREKEARAFRICQEKIADHGLEMKLVEVEYNFEGNKILFFFTAEGRVDFRALVKDLASVFHTRIELRQIGVRDEAKMLGGLGICGRPFCCSGFLDEFQPVSIKMAKTQNLSLNPTKISGTCGRLMCCLKYEQEAYEDAVKRMPKQESFVETPDGVGTVCQVNLLKEQVKVQLDDSPETPKCYRNCEICVVRNGKGKRPEDYVAPPPEELAKLRYVPPREEGVWERPTPERTALTEALERVFQAAEESAQPMREKKSPPQDRGSRSRGGSRRRRGSGEGKQAQEAVPEKKGKEQPSRGSSDRPQGEQQRVNSHPNKAKGERLPQQMQNQPSKENGESGEKKAPSRNRNRRRRRPSGGGQPPKSPEAE